VWGVAVAARASSLDAERRATLARLCRAAKRVDLKSLRGVRPRARERGGTARRTRAKTSIASRIPETDRGVARFRLATRGVARRNALI